MVIHSAIVIRLEACTESKSNPHPFIIFLNHLLLDAGTPNVPPLETKLRDGILGFYKQELRHAKDPITSWIHEQLIRLLHDWVSHHHRILPHYVITTFITLLLTRRESQSVVADQIL